MFTKRNSVNILVAAVVLALPSLSYGQWLYNDSGTPTSVWGPANNEHMATTFDAPSWGFKTDSLIIGLYRHTAGTGTMTFKVLLREDNATVHSNGCPSGGVDCAGPSTGTPKWTSEVQSFTIASGWAWKGVSLPDCVMVGNFIADIHFLTGGNRFGPLMDDGAPIPCCEGYLYYSSAWHEHWDAWASPASVGHYLIRVHGVGDHHPCEIQISKDQIFYGHAAIDWVEGPETITDSLAIANIACGMCTVSVIVIDNADFTWIGDPLPWYLASGHEKVIAVSFQTMTEGWRYGNLVVIHNGSTSPDTVDLSGIGWLGHWIENFNECDPWDVQQDSCTDEGWMLYSGGYSDQGCCYGHQYTEPGCMAMDMLISPPIANPDNAGVEVEWMNENRFSSYYYYHGFYWTSPNDTLFHWVSDIPPTVEGAWVEVGPYYICADSDSIQLGFLYAGEDADFWFIDDIMVDRPPPQPPILTHEHHSDDGPATWIDPDCIHITAQQVMDCRRDLSYVELWYKDLAGGSWASVYMSAVLGCDALYEATICDLDVCHTYGYYFYAADTTGLDTTLPATAPTEYFDVDIMDNTTDQIAYDNGDVWFVRYFLDWNGRFAGRFTPFEYPYYLGGAMVMVGNTFPNDNHEDIVVEVYNDDGVGGLPGLLLCAPITDVGTSWNLGENACDDTTFSSWIYAKIDPCVEVTEGDFYIAVRNRDGSSSPDMESFGYDSDGQTPGRNYCFYPDPGCWGPDTLDTYTGDIMIRALECACLSVAPPNVTILYNDTTGNVELRWADVLYTPSYIVYRSTTDPCSGFTQIGTVPAGTQFFADSIGANTKDFYYITGSCDLYPPLTRPIPPTSIPSMSSIGPMRIPGDRNRTATLRIDQPWPILERQLEMGILPKTISKKELARRTSGETKVKNRADKLIERFPRMSR